MGATHGAHTRACKAPKCALWVQGRILMTHPTKAIYGTLLRDFVKVSRGSSDEALYTDKDLEKALERSEVLDFHQTIDLDGIKARPALATPFMLVASALRIACFDVWKRLANAISCVYRRPGEASTAGWPFGMQSHVLGVA